MRLLIVRHAIAEDRASFAARSDDDDLRPLTEAGERKMRKGAQGLQQVVPDIDLLGTSPLVRAEATARIIADVYGSIEPVTVQALRPDHDADEVLSWLSSVRDQSTVAIVGHEPALSGFAGWVLGGAGLKLQKGAACLIEFDEAPAPGAGTLSWLLQPGHLRALR